MLLADDLVRRETPCLKQMVEQYNEVGGNLVAVMDVPKAHTDRYGILKTGKESGRWSRPSAWSRSRSRMRRRRPVDHRPLHPAAGGVRAPGQQSPGAGGEIQLTDAMALMCGRGRFHGYRFEGRRFDCGDKAGFIEANIAYALSPEDRPQGAGRRARHRAGPEH